MLGCGGGGSADAALTDAPGPCFESCNPVAQAGCVERCAFVITTDPGQCVFQCVADGTRDIGEPCAVSFDAGVDDCAAGGHCDVRDGTQGICRRFCSDGTCSSGTCQALDAGNYENPLGLCI